MWLSSKHKKEPTMNVIVEQLRAWPACTEGRDGMSARTVGEIMERAAVEIERLELQLRAGPLHQSDGAERLDRIGDARSRPPKIEHPFRIAQMVADALARECVAALEAGDHERSVRFADARRCVAELYDGTIR